MDRKDERYYYYFGVDIHDVCFKSFLAEIGSSLWIHLKKTSLEPILAKKKFDSLDYLFDEVVDKEPALRDPIGLFPTPGWFETVTKDHYQENNYEDSQILLRIREYCDEQIAKGHRDIETEMKNNPNDSSMYYYREDYIDSCKYNIEHYGKIKDQSTFQKLPAVKTIGYLLAEKPNTEDLDGLAQQAIECLKKQGIEESHLNFRLITQKVIEWNEVHEIRLRTPKNSEANI